jgi:glycerate 2-kinase
MKVLVCPDKFKGSLTAPQAAAAIARGIGRAMSGATIECCPLSDGGEGFVDAITRAAGGSLVTRRVTGPLPEMKVDATMGVIDQTTAVIEMASASGLALLQPADRNPLYTTTFGTGELIRFAVDMGCRQILLGIGGSATCDAGVGALQACGCHIILKSGGYAQMTEPLCGRDLEDVALIKSHRGSPVDGIDITIACDVTNPLLGPNGTAAVYGPQKGASADDVQQLERMLSELVRSHRWETLANAPGSGAAGGIGFGLRAVLGSSMTSGFDLVSTALRLQSRIESSDFIVTGEGSLDSQSASGKVTAGVLQLARAHRKRVAVIAGAIQGDPRAMGFDHAIAIRSLARDEGDSFQRATELVEQAAEQLAMAFAS